MTSIPPARLSARLASYTAMAGAALAATAATPTASANIIYSGPLNVAVPQTSAGIYFNFLTGATSLTSTGFAAYDFNPYLGTGLSFFFSGTATTGNAGLQNASGVYQVLAPGALISAAGTYGTAGGAAPMANYRAGETGGYLGVHFLNETTGAVNYGWVQLTTSAGTSPTQGFPATVLGYAFDDTGAGILAGQIAAVPEPATVTLLGVMAAGAVGVRQWRRRRAT